MQETLIGNLVVRPRMGSGGINNGCEYLVRGGEGAGGVHTGR